MEIRSTAAFDKPIDYILSNYNVITYYIDTYFHDNEELCDSFKIFNRYKKSDVIHFVEIIRKYEKITELTHEIIHELIEKIVVHECILFRTLPSILYLTRV